MTRHRFTRALAVALAVAGLGGLGGSGGSAAPPRAVVMGAPVHAGTPLAAAPLRAAPLRAAPPAIAPPARLRIPVLGVDAAVVPGATGVDGELGVPDDPRVIGWWQAGGAPGVAGAAGVLDGHVDTAADGPGALFRLAALRPGDAVSVESGSGTSSSFAVRSVRQYAKTALPQEVFTAGPDPQLVLITCGGHFDRATRQYADNVVVVADVRIAAVT